MRYKHTHLVPSPIRRAVPALCVTIAAVCACQVRAQSVHGPESVTVVADAQGAEQSLPPIERHALGRPLAPGSSGENDQVPAASTDRSAGSMSQTAVALAVVLGVIFVLATLVARIGRAASRTNLTAALGPGGSSPPGILEVLGRYPISRGHLLILLRVDRRVLLISQSSGGRRSAPVMQTLSEIDDPTSVASIQRLVAAHDQSRTRGASSFSDVLDELSASPQAATELHSHDNLQRVRGRIIAEHQPAASAASRSLRERLAGYRRSTHVERFGS
jgi:flagellar biogenesis protein FliO